jgi:arginyl-tRNA synthetase
MRFEKHLKSVISTGLKELFGIAESEVLLQETKKEFSGDVTLVVFPYSKSAGKSPEAFANELGEFIKNSDFPLASYNVVKGFLNLEIDASFWKNFLADSSTDSNTIFSLKEESITPQHLMVEYSSPNTNKPLHLGHIRNNLLGFSIAEILKEAGHTVEMVNLINDRGVHICKSMLAWEKFGHNETPESSGMKGDHLVGKYYVLYDKKVKEQMAHMVEHGMPPAEAEKKAPLQMEVQEMLRKWEAGDSHTTGLWKMMNGWVYEGFDVTYKKLGVKFDKIYYESQTYLLGKKIVEQGLESGAFYKKEDGSVWVDLEAAGLDHKLLLRGDGTSVYITQDIGTAQLRFDEFKGLEKLIYVVGNEQDYHFKVLREIFRKLGRSWADGIYHLSYGMVDLPSGKMKSREGTVVDADDLINEITEEAEMITKAQGKLDDFNSGEAKKLYQDIGMGALKYFILKVDPKKRMLFNPAESIDLNGNTGPFIQYTHARIKSVLRKGKAMLKEGDDFSNYTLSQEERNLIRLIYGYPQAVSESAAQLNPAVIANYAYSVAKAYNHFYHEHVIVDENNTSATSFRLYLSIHTAEVISRTLKLLGVNAPDRM